MADSVVADMRGSVETVKLDIMGIFFCFLRKDVRGGLKTGRLQT